MKTRIGYLDGLRGLAILLVIFFHAYARWPTLVPYGDQYGEFLIFRFGWLGVELFFLISGFVILMTLEKCATIREFLFRRWIRLFPAMLVCTVIIFITSNYFFERPAGIPNWESLLPGLTFIEPSWWKRVIGHPINPIEGAFWSLYVEFKFYVFAAILYYWRGRNTLICALISVFFIAYISKNSFGIGALKFLDSISTHLSFQFFGWFASGAAFYVYSQKKSSKWFAIAMFAAIASSIAIGGVNWQTTFAASLISLFFAASTVSVMIQKILSNRLVQFFGFVSYPLYLIHENMMVSIIIKLGSRFEDFPVALLPLPAIALLSGAAFVISNYFEPLTKFFLTGVIKHPAPRGGE